VPMFSQMLFSTDLHFLSVAQNERKGFCLCPEKADQKIVQNTPIHDLKKISLPPAVACIPFVLAAQVK
jgi:hypothetical protein